MAAVIWEKEKGNEKREKILQKKEVNVIEKGGNGKGSGVRYHCGGWSEEVNSCILISYMVYL